MALTLTRRTPYRSNWLANRDPFVQLMDSFFNGESTQEMSNRTWAPPVDIRETEEAYLVYAELPGLSKEDIEITLEENVLKLSGERRWEQDVQEEQYHRVERSYGSFTRAFSLPSRVDSGKVEAAFKDGVLTVTVPKMEEAKPRKIAIS